MIEIFLENKLDRYHLFKDMKEKLYTFTREEKVELLLAADRLIINVDNSTTFKEGIKPLLAEALKKHVIETKEELWLLDIIRTIFFYDDPEEQLQILAMAKSILSGERLELPNVIKLLFTEKIIYDAFMDFLTSECKFCYESFLTFRLRGYLDKLIDCVEMAIDEFQLEQEYQSLVESCRYYIKTEQAKLAVVHLVIDDTISFYDDFFQPLSSAQLEEYLNREIFFESGLPIAEMVISPLVSIAPEILYLYCDNFDHSVIQSIQNIFQERVKLYRKGEFRRHGYKIH